MTGSIQKHPKVIAILQALIAGRDPVEVAQEFGVQLLDLEEYAGQAGVSKRTKPRVASKPRRKAAAPKGGDFERQVLEESNRRRHRGEQVVEHPTVDAALEGLREAERAKAAELAAEEAAYRQQPRPHLTLTLDPQFRIGWQTTARHRALIDREDRERQARIAEWKADPWNWLKEPPNDL